MEKRKKVIIGMSGGVDSSVSAALLKKANFDVTGVFFIFSDKNDKSIEDAKKVSKILEIELIVADVRKKFKKEGEGYFLREYALGRTPNPCVICNERVKFKVLFEEMNRIKADHMATGHYARLWREFPISIPLGRDQFSNKSQRINSKSKIFSKLFQAEDKTKDQSYFLYRLPPKYLEKMIFPLGGLKKIEVKAMAKKLKLPVAEKKESQDVCFLSDISVDDFLKKKLVLKEGKIVDTDGKIVGAHSGLALYTIGQRRGINIGGTGPYWVVRKDRKRNILVVSNNPGEMIAKSREIFLKKVNWVSQKPKLPVRLLVQARYQGEKVYATIHESKKGQPAGKREYIVKFDVLKKAVAPGQSAVFYGETGEVIGGGIIK
jgi:tRNA-uridine 2-sulfurtransferase